MVNEELQAQSRVIRESIMLLARNALGYIKEV
jgi:hypothetical protein